MRACRPSREPFLEPPSSSRKSSQHLFGAHSQLNGVNGHGKHSSTLAKASKSSRLCGCLEACGRSPSLLALRRHTAVGTAACSALQNIHRAQLPYTQGRLHVTAASHSTSGDDVASLDNQQAYEVVNGMTPLLGQGLQAAATAAAAAAAPSCSTNGESPPQALLWADDDYGAWDQLGADAGSSSSSSSSSSSKDDVQTAGSGESQQHAATQQMYPPRAFALDVAEQQLEEHQQHVNYQQLYHRHSHHRYKTRQHIIGQQQEQQQLPLQPVVHSADYVQLLQAVALVHSWQAARRLLLRHQEHLQQAHIGLLWWQLRPKLLQLQQQQQQRRQQRQQCNHPQQQRHVGNAHQQQVLQVLCCITHQHVSSMTAQSLAYTLQGLAAAVAAGAVLLAPPAAAASPACTTTITAAATATAGVPSVVHLGADLPGLLLKQLLSVAGSCSAQQLARCLAGGQLLGWQLGSSNSTADSSSSSSSISMNSASNSSSSSLPDSGEATLCCWHVLEAASRGLLESSMPGSSSSSSSSRQGLTWSRKEAGQLLHSLAGYVSLQQLQGRDINAHEQQQQQRQIMMMPPTSSTCSRLLQQLADHACQVLVEPQPAGMQLGQGVTHTYKSNRSSNTDGSVMHVRAAGTADAARQNIITGSSSNSSSSSSSSSRDIASAVGYLQAAALLQLLPAPQHLEALLATLEHQLHCLPPQQLLQLLQALLDLQIEPWGSWLTATLSNLESGMSLLRPQQLLQLLLLLPRLETVQPSQQLLQGLAKMTAVHCWRYSWQQLAVLSLGFAALGYRPEPYWLKDYTAATAALMAGQQQEQQGQQQQQQPDKAVPGTASLPLHVLVDMLVGVSLLAPPAPPATWLAAVEQQLLVSLAAAAAQPAGSTAGSMAATGSGVEYRNAPAPASPGLQQQLQGGTSYLQQHGVQQGVVSPELAAAVLDAFGCLQHTPCQKLRQLLGNSDDGSSSSSGSSNGGGSSGASRKKYRTGRPGFAALRVRAAAEDAEQASVAAVLGPISTSSDHPNNPFQQQQRQRQQRRQHAEEQDQHSILLHPLQDACLLAAVPAAAGDGLELCRQALSRVVGPAAGWHKHPRRGSRSRKNNSRSSGSSSMGTAMRWHTVDLEQVDPLLAPL